MPHSHRTEPTTSSRDQPGGRTALLIVDMINCLDFDGGAALAPAAKRVTGVIAQLRSQADQADLPVIYVNDNFGAWHSEKSKLVDQMHALNSPLPGASIPAHPTISSSSRNFPASTRPICPCCCPSSA